MARFPVPRPVLAAVLLAAGVLAVFGRSIPYPFVYDDQWTVEKNPALERVLPIDRFFLDRETVALPAVGMGATIYRPLPTLFFALDAAAGLSPARMRFANLVLHAAAGAMLLALLSAMGFTLGASAFGAALFLFHPVQVETVAWITQRSNLMCALGLTAALWFYRRRRWAGAAACYAMALLSKETAVMAVLLLPLFDLALGRRKPRWPAFAAGAGMAAAYGILRWAVVGPPRQREETAALWANLMTGAASGFEYVKMLVAPTHLRASYRAYVTDPWTTPWTWVGLLLGAALAAAVVWAWRRNKRAAFFLAWVPVCLAPVLGLFQIDNFVAERFLYTALLGLGGLGAVFWDRLPPRRRVYLWAVPALWAALSFAQTGVWRDDLTLWSTAAAREPSNGFAQMCRAESLVKAGRRREGEAAYRQALDAGLLRRQAAAALTNLAILRLEEGDPQGALGWAEKALKAEVTPPALLVLTRALGILGRRAEALDALARLEALQPGRRWLLDLRAEIETIPAGGGTP